MASLCHFCSERGEVPGRQKLDLKAHRELGVDLIKDLLHRIGILDQGVDQSRQREKTEVIKKNKAYLSRKRCGDSR
jgi:predicted phosphoribosyltransferase